MQKGERRALSKFLNLNRDIAAAFRINGTDSYDALCFPLDKEDKSIGGVYSVAVKTNGLAGFALDFANFSDEVYKLVFSE